MAELRYRVDERAGAGAGAATEAVDAAAVDAAAAAADECAVQFHGALVGALEVCCPDALDPDPSSRAARRELEAEREAAPRLAPAPADGARLARDVRAMMFEARAEAALGDLEALTGLP